MTKYEQYKRRLERLLKDIDWGRSIKKKSDVISHNLNGLASSELRRLISLNHLRKFGAFFTNAGMAKKLVDSAVDNNPKVCHSAYDPTCGAGDLLLRWAERLEVESSLEETIEKWGELIGGIDIHQEFVDVAKRRLILLAIAKGTKLKGHAPNLDAVFPNLKKGSIMDESWEPPHEATILLNPPFQKIDAPEDCDWAAGKVSFAGFAFFRCIQKCQLGQKISAILPDVLRSGSRYANWRERVAQDLKINSTSILGKFDALTDIDVFVIAGQKSKQASQICSWLAPSRQKNSRSIGDLFNVHVGPLVAYREPLKGDYHPFLVASTLIHGETINSVITKRRYSGRLVKPPFIAIQRTSSPDDSTRPVASIVAGDAPIAVENHIITLEPIDGELPICETALASLKERRTQNWLNKSIRCRHLTVGSIKNLPLW